MILACKKIKKSFGVDNILYDVTFHINENEKVALVGVNGAGKSTLFKIINKEYRPDSGALTISNTTKVGYLSQHTELNSNKTIIQELTTVFEPILKMEEELRNLEKQMKDPSQNLETIMKKYSELQHKYDDINGYSYKSQISGILKGLGFNETEFNQHINELSGGQKSRVSLAKLLLTKPSILLLDEPTNHLDLEAVQWLEGFLKNYNGAILIISHDRYFLDKIVNKVIELEHGISNTYNGNYSFYMKQKTINEDIEMRHYLSQQKEIKKQKEVIDKLRAFNREKSIKRAKSREKALEKIEVIDKPSKLNDQMRLKLEPKLLSGNDVLHVENMKKSFDNKVLFSNISFDIKREQKVALIGANGIGKTTLLKIILNNMEYDDGTVKIGSKVKIAYYDQEQQNLSTSKTIFEEISDEYPKMTNVEIRNVLGAFLFTGDEVFKSINSLSGGERGRVCLAKIMLSEANFLLLDEPTNHLDIISKEILEQAINNYTGTILYISHDRYFINKTADQIIELTANNANLYLGNYDDYIEKKEQLDKINQKKDEKIISINAVTNSKQDWLIQKKQQAEERKRKSNILKTETKIGEIESKIDELDKLLCLEEYYTNAQKLQEIQAQKSECENILETLYSEWDKLNIE